jgi:predicted transport protein
MSPILIALLCLDGALLLAVLIFAVVMMFKHDSATVTEEKAPEVCEPAKEETVETAPVKEEIKEEVVEIKEEVAVAVDSAPETDDDDLGDDRDIIKRIPFSHKMLFIDKKTQSYYDVINNKFRSMRKINPRISSKGVSYRLGRELVAKITVRGKTMKLHLALDVAKFEEKIYFQKDLSSVKSYAEVPFTVKVKSDRGLKNALKLIDALMEAKAIESKTRYTEIDSIEALKEIAK